MPRNIQRVRLELFRECVPFQDIFPPNSAKLLEELQLGIRQGFESTDPAMVQELCLNGELKHLKLESEYGGMCEAFSVGATWRAVLDSLQVVHLDLPTSKGIPKILEQLVNLTTLVPWQHGSRRGHLTWSLDPFLDMFRLEHLELGRGYDAEAASRGTMCKWSPTALRFIGLAEKRIMQMRMTPPWKVHHLHLLKLHLAKVTLGQIGGNALASVDFS